MHNIKFNYRYRDAGNYKNHGWVVFDNPHNVELRDLETLIQTKLIDETYFYVDQWLLPDLHFSIWNNQLDHTWHEFESIEHTNEAPNTAFSLTDFMSAIEKVKPFKW
ncbi:hypothetical protein [Mucilaginibacter psychrotolerans]|uniref:Uncharacterized protein n=1 Tax=Mucilaginibacter psychrotolerans TaxID=1524096 RepID=A0A4Y8S3G8_9SPHI|nr:hypothetical protein [Mucilaginibacter psychrotolerans]TFF33503.1 hypothetical protein E2R66_25340 [Mucilaginibacter psychrotolerans]